jgi:hypothetical protein
MVSRATPVKQFDPYPCCCYEKCSVAVVGLVGYTVRLRLRVYAWSLPCRGAVASCGRATRAHTPGRSDG